MVRPKSIRSIDDYSVEVTVTCPFCGTDSVVMVPYDNAVAYYTNGELAQDAFPMLDADTREILISGICKKCQPEAFGE